MTKGQCYTSMLAALQVYAEIETNALKRTMLKVLIDEAEKHVK